MQSFESTNNTYINFRDFCNRNMTSPKQVQVVCGLSSSTLSRLQNGKAKPNPACVRLVEILHGDLPWKEWQGFRIRPEGIYPPREEQQYTSPDEIRGRFDLYQMIQRIDTENRLLNEKLEQSASPALEDRNLLLIALWQILSRGLDTVDIPEWVIQNARQEMASGGRVSRHY